jgi:hypothetical protein
MSTPQPDDQLVLVSPVYLAGIGDTATVYDPLGDTRGWGKAITEGGLCFTSPRLDVHVAYLPESRYGGWRITRYHEPLGMPIWSAAFSRCTPAEITAAFTQALADNLNDEHQRARRPTDVLAERGWREDNTPLHRYQWSPDGHAYLSQRNYDVDDTAELEGDYPTLWTMYACVEKAAGERWHATFTERVPLHLVTTAVSAFSSSEPVERPRSGIPERNLPYLTAEPAPEADCDRLRTAALARTSHALPASPAPTAEATVPRPTPPVPFRRR